MLRSRVFFRSFAIVSALIVATSAQAEIFTVPSKGKVKIDRHQTCRVVSNVSATSIMVPTNTVQEWSVGRSSFLQNITNMNGVTAAQCSLSPVLDSKYKANCATPPDPNFDICWDMASATERQARADGVTIIRANTREYTQISDMMHQHFMAGRRDVTLEKICEIAPVPAVYSIENGASSTYGNMSYYYTVQCA